MAHPHKRAKKDAAEEQAFLDSCMKLARKSLETAIEWIDRGDDAWALNLAKRAVALLEARRQI